MSRTNSWLVTGLAVVVTAAVTTAVVMGLDSGDDDPKTPEAAAPTETSPAAPVPVGVSVIMCNATCGGGAATEADIAHVQEVLEEMAGVTEVDFVSQEEAYQRFVEVFADDPDLLATIRPDDLAVSFDVVAENPDDYPTIRTEAEALPGVDEVTFRAPESSPTPTSTS